MKGCQTNIEFLFSYHKTKADESTDCVWFDKIFFFPTQLFSIPNYIFQHYIEQS